MMILDPPAIRNGGQDTINDAGQQIVGASSTSRRR
jgi:hypothetical protein